MRNEFILNNLFYRKQVKQLLKMPPKEVDSADGYDPLKNGWDICKGEQKGNRYVVTFIKGDEVMLTMKYPLHIYREVIKPLQNTWIDHPALNRSGLASLIWSDKEPNKLRRRLEQKAERDTFNQGERERIEKALLELYAEFKRK